MGNLYEAWLKCLIVCSFLCFVRLIWYLCSCSRPTDSVERRELTLFLKRETVALRKLFHESYMLSYHDCHHGPHCMVLVDLPPR